MTYIGHSLFLPTGSCAGAVSHRIAFSGVGIGLDRAVPWLPAHRRSGWRAACWALLSAARGAAAAQRDAARRRPEDVGLRPDGDTAPVAAAPSSTTSSTRVGVGGLDARPRDAHGTVLVALRRLLRRAARLVHGAGAPDQVPADIGFDRESAAWALGVVGLTGIVGQIALGWLSDAWDASGHGRSRPRLRRCYAALLLLPAHPSIGLLLCHGGVAGASRLWARLRLRRHSLADLPGPPLRDDLRHAHARRQRRRRIRAWWPARSTTAAGTYTPAWLLAIGGARCRSWRSGARAARKVRAVAGASGEMGAPKWPPIPPTLVTARGTRGAPRSHERGSSTLIEPRSTTSASESFPWARRSR